MQKVGFMESLADGFVKWAAGSRAGTPVNQSPPVVQHLDPRYEWFTCFFCSTGIRYDDNAVEAPTDREGFSVGHRGTRFEFVITAYRDAEGLHFKPSHGPSRKTWRLVHLGGLIEFDLDDLGSIRIVLVDVGATPAIAYNGKTVKLLQQRRIPRSPYANCEGDGED